MKDFLLRATGFILLGLLSGGCAISGDYGQFVRSVEVDALIESAKVLDDHAYYFTGPEARPDAIIAIENSRTLTSKYWIRVDDVQEKLLWWNHLLQNDTLFMSAYEGYWILAPDGRRAGVWYSRYDQSVVRFPDAATIILYTPSPMDENRKKLQSGFLRTRDY